MKKAIIIGANGQDGYFLANLLEQKEYNIVRIDLNVIQPPLGFKIDEPFNICEPSHIDTLVNSVKPDEIYHLAAFHHSAQDSYDETLDTYKKSVNIHEISLFNILASIIKFSPSTRLFYAASSHVFGDPPSEIQDEYTPINPINLYGITKASGLFLCRKFRKEFGVFASCGILYNHESSRRKDTFVSKKIVNGVLKAKRDRSAVLELGDLDSIVDWGYAPDYVEAMVKILNLSEPDEFIVATGIKHTVKDFVFNAFAIAGLDWQNHVIQKKDIIRRITNPMIGNSTKLRKMTGWAPTITFEEMVKLLVVEGINNDRK